MALKVFVAETDVASAVLLACVEAGVCEVTVDPNVLPPVTVPVTVAGDDTELIVVASLEPLAVVDV